MGTYIAKLKGEDNRFYKLVDGEENEDYNKINLSDALPYDPDNQMSDQWFKLKNFNLKEGFLGILGQSLDSADLLSINRQQYSEIEFIAFYQNSTFYIQYVSTKSFLKKRWFCWPTQELVAYNTSNEILYINPIPNCIYNQENHCLYFKAISKAYAIFKELKFDYKAATEEEVSAFLSSDIVDAVNFNPTKVGIANRKRISSVLNKYNNYDSNQRMKIKSYIKDMTKNVLEYTEQGKFKIDDDKKLRVLLMGIQQRFYIPPLKEDAQVATSTTPLTNLLQ